MYQVSRRYYHHGLLIVEGGTIGVSVRRARNTVVDRFSRHRFSRNPDLVENFAVTNHFYSIKIQYSRKFDLVD